MFTISIGRKTTSSASPKKGRKASKKPTDTGTAIALAMAAVKSTLEDGIAVPGTQFTVGELRTKAEGVRPNGTTGAWYPNCHSVAMEDRPAATEWLKAKGQRPSGGGKSVSVPDTAPALAAELALLKAQMALLVSGKPLPAEGHTIAAEAAPAKPTVEFDGVTYEVTVGTNGRLYGTPKS